MLKNRNLSLLNALRKVAQYQKSRSKTASNQTVASLTCIKDALENASFEKSEVSALKDILEFVEKLKHIRDELDKGRSVLDIESKQTLNAMLSEGADISTLYNDIKHEIGSKYFSCIPSQRITLSDISKFGSVLVLILYICDIAEQAARKMKPQFESQERSEAAMGAEEYTPREQPEVNTFDEPDTSHIPEAAIMASGTQILLAEIRRLRSDHEKMNRKLDKKLTRVDKKLDQAKEELGEEVGKVKKELGQEVGKAREEVGKAKEELKKKMEDTAKLEEQIVKVKRAFNGIKEALNGQSEMEAKVSDLERKVQNLLDPDMDMNNLMENIQDIQKEVNALEATFQGDLSTPIMQQLQKMNQILKEILLKLTKPSLAERTVQQISSIKEEYRYMLEQKKFTLTIALKKVAQSRKWKSRSKTASDQTAVSLTCIKGALKSSLFDETEVSALTDMLDLVKRLKHIRDELNKERSVPGPERNAMEILNSKLSEGADISTLFDDVKCGIGSRYLTSYSLQMMSGSDKSMFGSVLFLIPYLCDIAEQAIQKMKPQFSSQGEFPKH
ncbi:Hypp3388 [Branchiostoma lanceolatum]|uniref:Hypp3388 protein n=1 Tax=Branchiostoma lanceolatum TaxID=7740 RepID=A0A8K0EU62_BRALA|nr:Hypp3388 [Branchiostoma lanceolatum]